MKETDSFSQNHVPKYFNMLSKYNLIQTVEHGGFCSQPIKELYGDNGECKGQEKGEPDSDCLRPDVVEPQAK